MSDRAGGGLRGDVVRQLARRPSFLAGALLLAVLAVMAAVPQLFTATDPQQCTLSRSRQPPSADAWFGYDPQGCDYYANVVHGARVSVVVGVAVVGATVLLAVALGSLAGYLGGVVDTLVSRATDVAFGIPLVLGAILVVNGLRDRLGDVTLGGLVPPGFLLVVLALAVLGWMTPLRLVRAGVLEVRDADYVLAARALGAGGGRIVLRHILPNALGPVLVHATLSVGVVVAAEATLSFLGVGLQAPAVSWGLQIDLAQQYLRTSPWLLLFPGLFLSATVLAFMLVGDALRDALDPRLR